MCIAERFILTFSEKRTGFKPGDKAPYAYNDVFKYPEDYEPWNFNYKGNGLFYGFLGLSIFSKMPLIL
jgi:hypothetical protein